MLKQTRAPSSAPLRLPRPASSRSAPLPRPVLLTQASSGGDSWPSRTEETASTSSPSPTLGGKTLDQLVPILSEDLSHLFDEKGVDPKLYADKVEFRDPITKYDNIQGYLFNIKFLKLFFRPEFYLHGVRKTGPAELTSRWAMVMYFPSPLRALWAPVLKFTGESIYGFDQEGRINRHIDTWDSIRGSQAYFSHEGLNDLLAQLGTLANEPQGRKTPSYSLLRKKKEYEVREYSAFPMLQYSSTNPRGEREGTRAYKALIRASSAASPTAPTLQWAGKLLALPLVPQEAGLGEAAARAEQANGWPIEATRFEKGLYAVKRFSGFASAQVTDAKLREIRASLRMDGLVEHPARPWILATYHGDDEFKSFKRLNEIWVPLEANSFSLWPRDTPGRG